MRLLLALIVLSATIVSCNKLDLDQTNSWEADTQDASGNIMIINESGRKLVLYKDEEIIKKIPASSTDYLVNIPNATGGAVELQLYDWEDIKDEVELPATSNLYKNWKVVLSNSTNLEDRVTWHVSADAEYTSISTISFSYFGGTENSVDVFLNGKTGSKVMSLKPGDQYRKVGLDYGNYTLHYNYWYSDQNSADNTQDNGWIERQNVMGEESYIWLVTNENRQDQTIIIPHQDAAVMQSEVYGSVRITNNTPDLVQVYSGGRLIEEVCYLEEGINQNLSSLVSSDSYTYIMPIKDLDNQKETFTLTAKNVISGAEVEAFTFELIADSLVTWVIGE